MSENKRDCELHGYLKRKCPVCESIEDEKRLVELEAENVRLKDGIQAAIQDVAILQSDNTRLKEELSRTQAMYPGYYHMKIRGVPCDDFVADYDKLKEELKQLVIDYAQQRAETVKLYEDELAATKMKLQELEDDRSESAMMSDD